MKHFPYLKIKFFQGKIANEFTTIKFAKYIKAINRHFYKKEYIFLLIVVILTRENQNKLIYTTTNRNKLISTIIILTKFILYNNKLK